VRTIILIRHGQSTFTAHHEATGEDPGHFDTPLTDLGLAQAKEAGAVLEQTELDLVISSPLTRAIQTGETMFAHRSLPFEITCRHREFLEASCDVGSPPARLKEKFPHLAFDHLSDPWWHHDPTSSEPFTVEPRDIFERRVEEFEDWLRAHEARRIAVIGHGTFFHAMIGRWMRNCEIHHWQAD
jgi:broad specificity phosphatase PhoE